MRSECNIIRDLLPLCIEDMASPDSAVFVGEAVCTVILMLNCEV